MEETLHETDYTGKKLPDFFMNVTKQLFCAYAECSLIAALEGGKSTSLHLTALHFPLPIVCD